MPEATTLTETEQQKQTDKPEHHQTQAATGSPQAGGSSTAGSTLGGNSGSTSTATGSSMAGSTGTAGVSGSQTGSTTTGTMPSSGRPSTGMSRRGVVNPLSMLGNPLSMMRSLVDDMDRFFEDFLGFGGVSPSGYRQPLPGTGTGSALQGTGGGYGTSSLWYPQIEVSQRGGNLVICADLPGIRKEDVHLEIHDDYLVLEGERRQENEENQGGVYRSERSYGRFYRTIPLPDGVSSEQVRANFKDGVLEVKVPMPTQEQRQGRRIEIQEG